MAFNISQFTNQLVNDGARPNLFKIQIPTLPAPLASNGKVTNLTAGGKLEFMARSAQIPGSTIGQVPIYYFGREVKLAGNRTFADWSPTIINDEDFVIRNSLETWMNYINGHVSNVRGNGNGPLGNSGNGINSYACDAFVYQYGKDGTVIQQYNIVGLFPVDLTPIDLNWESNNAIEEFSVTFTFQYWTNTNSTT
jgi:hypothetical protein